MARSRYPLAVVLGAIGATAYLRLRSMGRASCVLASANQTHSAQ
jgi:hypothetical protein